MPREKSVPKPEDLPVRPLDAGKTGHKKEDFDRLFAYLESLGLPSAHAESQALRLLQEAEPGGANDGSSTPLGRLISRVESWLTWLREEAGKQAHEKHGILGLHLRSVLGEHPEIFLQREGLPESVRAAVEASAHSVIPEEAGMAMPMQPINLSSRQSRHSRRAGPAGKTREEPEAPLQQSQIKEAGRERS